MISLMFDPFGTSIVHEDGENHVSSF
jgi:hypothetical protein